MPTIRITALPELAEQPADDDVLALEDISAGTTKKVTSAHVRAGLASNAGLSAEVSAREAHEAAANPHSGSASTTALGLVDTAVSTHVARTDNPHSVTAAQAGAIPATSGAATPYVSAASEAAAGISELSTLAEAVTGTDAARVVTVTAARQAQISLIRDTLGKFAGVVPPSLNLFCRDQASDTAPVGTFTRSTTGTRLGQAGLIETVAAGSIRREWLSTGGLNGWCIETTETNALTYSEQFDNAAWGKYNATVSANASTSPDGNATADKVIESAASSTHIVYKTISTTLSSPHSFSIFVKKSERSRFSLYVLNNASQGNYIKSAFNINDGSCTLSDAGNGSASRCSLEEIGKGWYLATLIGIPDSSTGAGTAYLQVRLADTDGNEGYLGNGSSGIYIWGAQFEATSIKSSYIQTTASAVVRSPDVWTVPISPSWFNTVAGTIFMSGKTPNGVPGVGTVRFLTQYDDGSSDNRICIVRDENGDMRCLVTTSSSGVLNLNLGDIADRTMFSVAFSWSTAGFSASLNGGAVVTGAAAALPGGLTTHRIGSDSTGGRQWGGHVHHDAYFPVALSDAQLQAITL